MRPPSFPLSLAATQRRVFHFTREGEYFWKLFLDKVFPGETPLYRRFNEQENPITTLCPVERVLSAPSTIARTLLRERN